MRNKEYVQKAKQAILNRVRFHAPVVYDASVDFVGLEERGINTKLPVFKFDKTLSNRLFKAFVLAQREEKFNLVIGKSCLEKIPLSKLKKIENVVVFDQQFCSVKFMEAVNKLNINYPASSNYDVTFKEKFLKVDGQILNPHYDDFSLIFKGYVNDISVEHCEFVLNGTNFFVKLENSSSESKKVCLELNIPLEKGYYYFKKMRRCVLVENLMSKHKTFFNFIANGAKLSYSCVNGLENSVFSCINLKWNVCLEAKQKTFFFCNFGESQFAFKGEKEVEHFKHIAWEKSCEIFNVRVKTKNPKFDHFFNFSLPQKIWTEWLNGQCDSSLESKYVGLKRLFVNGTDKLSLVNFKEIGLREVGIFNGEYFKRIFIVQGDERFLKVGKTTFHNINGITMRSLSSKEPISLCFGLLQ